MDSYVVAPVPESLAARALEVAYLLRKSDPHQYKQFAVEVISEMTKVNLEYHFLRPIALLKLGGLAASISNIAIRASQGAIMKFVKRGIDKLSDEQLLIVADLIDECVILNRNQD